MLLDFLRTCQVPRHTEIDDQLDPEHEHGKGLEETARNGHPPVSWGQDRREVGIHEGWDPCARRRALIKGSTGWEETSVLIRYNIVNNP